MRQKKNIKRREARLHNAIKGKVSYKYENRQGSKFRGG